MCKNDNIDHYPKFSVLMSLYYKEKPTNLRECFDSLLNQSVLANEWVIVKDGPLNDGLEDILKEYEVHYPNLIKYVEFKSNQGLGLALRAGVPACSHELIARMDTDDICRKDRFEIQLKEFINDEALDICGSHIKEFDTDTDNICAKRKVPLTNDEIVNYQKRRSAYNHMTVMFKKSSVLKSGNYEHVPLMEDDMLWTRMIIAGCKGKNIDDYLVFVRTGLSMISRRGGWSYFKKYSQSRKKVYQLGLASYRDYLFTLIVQFIVALTPKKIRQLIFIKALRS